MSIHVKLTGTEEFRKLLRNLPEELTGDAAAIVFRHADAAAASIRAAYPVSDLQHRHLADSVTVEKEGSGRFGVLAIIRNRHPISHLYEWGSAQRTTKSGANRGAMPSAPPGHAFIPRAILFRRQMFEALKAMLVSHGLLVSGEAE